MTPADRPLLILLAGRPGTGKTTLATRLARELDAGYVRVDAIETVLLRTGTVEPPVGPVGYTLAHEIALGMLRLGRPVVVDAVNPVAEARAGWLSLAEVSRPVFLETVVHDESEHRRRVSGRRPDLAGQTVPTWAEVQAGGYEPWDETRDGPRHLIDTTDMDEAAAAALAVVRATVTR
ncbi:P-loop nucleotide/nucleoside kinase family protein [Microlunatus parietis]|uniref:Putative kinase n=1 Tax=Microlunatus parietis TaxID=682979 RepID=A0A7Y9LDW0_9ACTN|nr:AAA family ATPase [Microlunatus parietis]NYE74327.1 putative kinase [Microlunatus parietis]